VRGDTLTATLSTASGVDLGVSFIVASSILLNAAGRPTAGVRVCHF